MLDKKKNKIDKELPNKIWIVKFNHCCKKKLLTKPLHWRSNIQ